MERFLQACAEGNMRVANCTTPAQYFHLLRRQAMVLKPRPLVLMTPKSLLRLPAATSTMDELADGAFQRVIDDHDLPGSREDVTKLVLCSGKVYYDIVGNEDRDKAKHIAVARVEMLYPFPENELQELIESYPNLERVYWVQEEPRNMGPRAFMRRRMAAILPERAALLLRGPPAAGGPGRGLRGRPPQGTGPHRARGAGSRGGHPRARRLRGAQAALAARPPSARVASSGVKRGMHWRSSSRRWPLRWHLRAHGAA